MPDETLDITAATYQRVSTREQASVGGRDEGFSIPAQRQANARKLLAAGVTLVSATENIDETPSDMLLHGIMSSIAKFYSKNLATEVTKGLTQKVATGGTPMRAPLGYLNFRTHDKQSPSRVSLPARLHRQLIVSRVLVRL